MGAKRTKATGMSERVGVTEERVNNLYEQLPGVREDLGEVKKALNAINVTIATLPTWEAIKAVDKEAKEAAEALEVKVNSLESARSAIKVGWTVVSCLGGVACVIIGWAISIWAK